jgi:peptide-methionine (R)-S-oxide reductase
MNARALILKITACCGAALLLLAPLASAGQDSKAGGGAATLKKVSKTDEEWRRLLTPEQFEVMRRKGTEAPYSSPLNKVKGQGTFVCAACQLPLFSSRTKYDSRTGWPSFWQPVSRANVREEADRSQPGEPRTEVLCARCGSHLGHVFDDGPDPTGLRYCMNGLALKFVPRR